MPPLPVEPIYAPGAAPDPPAPENRRHDWILGVLIGLVLGVGVVAAFVFIGAEETVDAPRISGVDTGKPGQEGTAAPGEGETGP